MGRAFGSDAIYTTDGGNTSLWAHWLLPSTRPRSYLNILELGMLGTGIPSALGAKLASPEREVVCGNGGGRKNRECGPCGFTTRAIRSPHWPSPPDARSG
ncbi:MAG: hypothetical protein JRH10_21045 [Deltaproteobacteria bacterium]|nr:hypothetical protein [Deltaproteobacteria bacterium]